MSSPLLSIFDGFTYLADPLVQPIFVEILYLILGNLGTILTLWQNGDRTADERDIRSPLEPEEYDFIIVGAGSAGCLLANRLSATYNVLLLEYGGEPNPLQFIPFFGLALIGFPQIDFRHRTVPQKRGSLMSVNGESSWSTGLGLGGTGNLNLMIHLRGHKKDFDKWANLTGDNSWNWEGVLPYFKSYEDYDPEEPRDEEYHGYGGPLRVEAPSYIGNAWNFVTAAEELGYPNVDLNAPFKEGFDIIRYPIKRGARQAPYKAFLEPIRQRNTLTIMKFAQVNRVLFHNGNVAYGVEYDRHGRTYTAHARREVIISAGSVGTPKVLMLSGVGPKAQLDSLNIPVVSDVPVGENLQDHYAVYLGPIFIKQGTGNYLDRDITPAQFIKYLTLGEGRLTTTGCEASGAVVSSYAKARGATDWPDLHLFLYSLTNTRIGPQAQSFAFNLKTDEVAKYEEGSEGRDAVYLTVSGARPFSRGYIRLGGSSPYDMPIIEPNYLGDKDDIDLKVLMEGVKLSLFLMENTTTGREQFESELSTNLLPACAHLTYRSDPYLECFIRQFAVTLHHPVGTATMGTVVDTQLRVIGTQRLRVADASIQPRLVVTNTQASTLMIAEKASDMILTFWNEKLAFRTHEDKNKPEKIKINFENLGKDKFGYNRDVPPGFIDESLYWKAKKRVVSVVSNDVFSTQ